MGINLKDLIYEVCGGMEEGHELLAVQTGGASGAIINASQIDMTLDIDQVSNSGGRLGCGTILVLRQMYTVQRGRNKTVPADHKDLSGKRKCEGY